MSDMTNTTTKQRATARHPLLIGREEGVWHPDLVGRVPGYAKTEAGYIRRQEAARKQAERINAEGKRGTRKGIPDGYGGRRADVEAIRAGVDRAADKIVAALDVDGEDDQGNGPQTELDWGKRREAVLKAAMGIMLDPTRKTRDRSRAANEVLKLTKKRPGQPGDITVPPPPPALPPAEFCLKVFTAEAWLNELAAETEAKKQRLGQ